MIVPALKFPAYQQAAKEKGDEIHLMVIAQEGEKLYPFENKLGYRIVSLGHLGIEIRYSTQSSFDSFSARVKEILIAEEL